MFAGIYTGSLECLEECLIKLGYVTSVTAMCAYGVFFQYYRISRCLDVITQTKLSIVDDLQNVNVLITTFINCGWVSYNFSIVVIFYGRNVMNHEIKYGMDSAYGDIFMVTGLEKFRCVLYY
jgi:hypothetical protein